MGMYFRTCIKQRNRRPGASDLSAVAAGTPPVIIESLETCLGAGAISQQLAPKHIARHALLRPEYVHVLFLENTQFRGTVELNC